MALTPHACKPHSAMVQRVPSTFTQSPLPSRSKLSKNRNQKLLESCELMELPQQAVPRTCALRVKCRPALQLFSSCVMAPISCPRSTSCKHQSDQLHQLASFAASCGAEYRSESATMRADCGRCSLEPEQSVNVIVMPQAGGRRPFIQQLDLFINPGNPRR